MSEKLLSKRDLIVGAIVAIGFGCHFLGLVDWPWFIDWIVATWFYTIWGFFALIHAQAVMLRTGGSWWVTWMSPLLILFIPADALFNAIFGTAFFKEFPKWPDEFLFSSRVERHYRNERGHSSDRQVSEAIKWHARLKAVDPIGHDFDK